MITLKNWFVTTPDIPFTAPELLPKRLSGNVYGHPKFEDGTPVDTNSIVDIEDCGDHKIVKTKSGTLYTIFASEIRSDYGSWCPDAFERLKMIN